MPFQNLSALVASGGEDDHVHVHKLGRWPELGLCYDRNVVLGQILVALGFAREDVRVVGARTRFFREQPANQARAAEGDGIAALPFDHICLCVWVGGVDGGVREAHLVDVANGNPYFSPLNCKLKPRLDACAGGAAEEVGQECHHSNLHYRVASFTEAATGEKWLELQHRREGREEWLGNYLFREQDVLDSGFGHGQQVEAICRRHREDPDFGHLLRSVRVSKWSRFGNSVIVRDNVVRVLTADGKEESKVKCTSLKMLCRHVEQHFGDDVASLLRQAAEPLRKWLGQARERGRQRVGEEEGEEALWALLHGG